LTYSSIVLSQVLAIICANILTYLEIVLLSAKFVGIYPLIVMTAIQVVVIFIWTAFISVTFIKIFPPRRLLVLYEEYNPSLMAYKIKRRNDRYKIEGYINIKETEEEDLHETIRKYDAVLIY